MTPAPTDFSVFHLFAQADIFVKAIMVLLIFMSVLTWAIWFSKAAQFRRLRKMADRFEESFWRTGDLGEKYKGRKIRWSDHPMLKVYLTGLHEYDKAKDNKGKGELPVGVVDRARQMMSVIMIRELEKMESMISTLATIASSAPFIGLLGTVWGIMNSFQSIGVSKNTSLAVVAPGIAEALLATALGLVAAIPAVVAYNRLAGEMGRYSARLEAFATEFVTLLERKREVEKTGGTYKHEEPLMLEEKK